MKKQKKEFNFKEAVMNFFGDKCKNKECGNRRRNGSSFCQPCSDKHKTI